MLTPFLFLVRVLALRSISPAGSVHFIRAQVRTYSTVVIISTMIPISIEIGIDSFLYRITTIFCATATREVVRR